MNDLTSIREQNLWVWATCAETGAKVMGKGSNEQIATSDKEGMWWSCPACGGWHVSIVKGMAQKKSENNPEMTSRPDLAHQLQPSRSTSGSKTNDHKENPFVEILSPFSTYSSLYWTY